MFFLPVLSLLFLSALTSAHMLMVQPAPFGNPTTSPLSKSGENFPCQSMTGAGESGESVAAGSDMPVKLSNSICHGGGSGQFSLSFDSGESWMLISSHIGGFPIVGEYSAGQGQGECQYDYTVTIPADAPSGPAIFAWSWYNRVGAREMYMNCADLTITGGGQGFTAPQMDTANIYGDGTCVTKEGVDFVYANPGNVVTYGGSYTSDAPGATSYTGSCDITPGLITVDESGKVTQGGSGKALDEKTDQAAADTSGSASVFSAPSAGDDGQYTPDAIASSSSTADLDDTTKVSDKTQTKVAKADAEVPTAGTIASVGSSAAKDKTGSTRRLCKSKNASWVKGRMRKRYVH